MTIMATVTFERKQGEGQCVYSMLCISSFYENREINDKNNNEYI